LNVAVVRQKRNGNGQQENNPKGSGRKLVSHSIPPYSCPGQHSVLHGRPRAGAILTISVLTAHMGTFIHPKSFRVNQIVFFAVPLTRTSIKKPVTTIAMRHTHTDLDSKRAAAAKRENRGNNMVTVRPELHQIKAKLSQMHR
jgi:hypothetical protein